MIERIMKYKHIIWDWNGTLIDDECKLFSEAEEVLKKISDMGISQSILSASKEDVLIKSLASWGLRLLLSVS